MTARLCRAGGAVTVRHPGPAASSARAEGRGLLGGRERSSGSTQADVDSLQNTSSRSHPSSPDGSAAFGEKVISGRPHLAGRTRTATASPPAAHPRRPPAAPRHAWAPRGRGAHRAAQGEGRTACVCRGGGRRGRRWRCASSRPALQPAREARPRRTRRALLAPGPRVPGPRRRRRPLASLPSPRRFRCPCLT